MIYLCSRSYFLFVLLFLGSPALCFAGLSVQSVDPQIAIDAGIRTDQFDWNIAGTTAGTGPNVLSELSWKDLRIAQLRLKGSLDIEMAGTSWVRPYLLAELGVGRIYAGRNQDSDYNGDNRTLEFSRSNNVADKGDVLDLSLALGQKFSLFQKRLSLTPLIGYSYHQQNLQLLEGRQTIPSTGPFVGLNSHYDAQWWGVWFGLAAELRLTDQLLFRSLSEYHRVDYSAEGDWNLRTDFAHPVSFAHNAEGSGWIQEIGLEHKLREKWSLTLAGIFQLWQTDAGRDRIFLATGSSQDTRLNQVNWSSVSLQFGLNYAF